MSDSLTRMAHVLVIDDDPSYGPFACRILKLAGYKAHLAINSSMAVGCLMDKPPDLILLDIHLPGIDGIQFFKLLRRCPPTRHIPIILMTAEMILDSILDAATGHLKTEPVFHKSDDKEVLLERVERTLAARAAKPEEPASDEGIVRKGPIVINLVRREVSLSDGSTGPTRVSPRPFELLLALLRQEEPVSQNDLRRELWPEDADTSVVAVNIRRLRHDLTTVKRLCIETVGDSYQLVIDPSKRT